MTITFVILPFALVPITIVGNKDAISNSFAFGIQVPFIPATKTLRSWGSAIFVIIYQSATDKGLATNRLQIIKGIPVMLCISWSATCSWLATSGFRIIDCIPILRSSWPWPAPSSQGSIPSYIWPTQERPSEVKTWQFAGIRSWVTGSNCGFFGVSHLSTSPSV